MDITITPLSYSSDLTDKSTQLEVPKDRAAVTQGTEFSSSQAKPDVDSVSLSGTSSPMSPDRQARLIALQQAIDNGTYSVPASAVAEAMIKKGVMANFASSVLPEDGS